MGAVYISGDGSKLVVGRGGQIEMDAGSTRTKQGTQQAAIADVPTGGSADNAANAAAINSILATMRALGDIAS